ncbi:putative protein OS=Streptomyces aurantiogriseus OX=66870 GN=GCM10010251_08490 PE=4 SV=1 [Streptomyces aurantiogriseus]|uniref:Uncharacterized protein n=1 Tax=Streptomyces aurantiogriseus TaxID=66870 RepID=A0A918BWN5_9ACTN|nr:hypothetical protein GCM10010251_08490 [Streptomyces aurantiogriseus]
MRRPSHHDNTSDDAGRTYGPAPVGAPSDDLTLTGLRLVRDALVCDVTAGEYGYDLPYPPAWSPPAPRTSAGARPDPAHGLTLRTEKAAEYPVRR